MRSIPSVRSLSSTFRSRFAPILAPEKWGEEGSEQPESDLPQWGLWKFGVMFSSNWMSMRTGNEENLRETEEARRRFMSRGKAQGRPVIQALWAVGSWEQWGCWVPRRAAGCTLGGEWQGLAHCWGPASSTCLCFSALLTFICFWLLLAKLKHLPPNKQTNTNSDIKHI